MGNKAEHMSNGISMSLRVQREAGLDLFRVGEEFGVLLPKHLFRRGRQERSTVQEGDLATCNLISMLMRYCVNKYETHYENHCI